ncbi:hypothetical protein L0337_37875, partial [candidate division KSB1 bacterium]|nr:hypothetical protein [candidate division KSB1 bacterium]
KERQGFCEHRQVCVHKIWPQKFTLIFRMKIGDKDNKSETQMVFHQERIDVQLNELMSIQYFTAAYGRSALLRHLIKNNLDKV